MSLVPYKKRSASPAKKKAKKPKKQTRGQKKITDLVIPGYTRTGGTYGRFSSSSAYGPEYKFKDTYIQTLTGDHLLFGYPIAISMGTGPTQRIGTQIIIKKICVRGIYDFLPSNLANTAPIADVYLIQDTQTNGASAAWGDVFNDDAVVGQAWLQYTNLNNIDRFKILKHWKMGSPYAQSSNQAGTSGQYTMSKFRFDCELDVNIPVFYSGTTGDASELTSNSIFFGAGGYIASNETWNIYIQTRILYTDP